MAALIFVIVTGIIVFIGIQRADQGIMPFIRRIPALDAFDEAVGRSVELGRQTFFTIGGARMGGTWTGGTLAAISMLRYTANLAAEKGARLWAGTSVVDHIPLVDDAMRTGFQESGAPEAYSFERDVHWFPNQMAYIAGCAGIYAREPPASQILLGSYMAECLAMCEIGRRGGAFMIGGTDYRPYMPYMLAICDYALIGEEIFIASAYVSDDPQLKNTIWVEDMMKLILLGLAVIGVLANLGGIEAFGTLLGS
jgi:hypothetical protein